MVIGSSTLEALEEGEQRVESAHAHARLRSRAALAVRNQPV